MPFGRSELLSSSVYGGRKLTTHSKETKQIYEFWLKLPEGLDHGHQPGDSIGLFPRNDPAEVQQLIEQQEWTSTADKPFRIEFSKDSKKKKSLLFVPDSGSTMRKVLINCIDIHRPPSKMFLLAILRYCKDDQIQHQLKILCAKETMNLYNSEIMEKRVTIKQLLIELDIRIPFSVLVEHSTRLLPRPYSIVNGPSRNPNELRMIFSWHSSSPGVATTMLKKIITDQEEHNNQVYFYLRNPSPFRLEKDDVDKNVIMIGPGLGVVPFLGFLDELEYLRASSTKTRIIFTSWRQRGADDVIKGELQDYSLLNELLYAYTRDGDSEKMYVQDLILSRKKSEVANLLLESNTKLFICGEGKVMIPQIEKAIVSCIADHLQLDSAGEDFKNIWKMAKEKIVIEQWF